MRDRRVSLLLDRACFTGEAREWHPGELRAELCRRYGPSVWTLKQRFARRVGVPWYFVAFRADPQRVYVVDLCDASDAPVAEFHTFADFGRWTLRHRSLAMKSPYHEEGLPLFDRILRAERTPWPGNLDGVLGGPGSTDPLALVEFQNTEKVSVAMHSNDRWFLPTRDADGRVLRKGDEQRWRVSDRIRHQSGLPFWVIVWSSRESVVKLKNIREIVFSDDSLGRSPGLTCDYERVLDRAALLRVLGTFCQRKQRLADEQAT